MKYKVYFIPPNPDAKPFSDSEIEYDSYEACQARADLLNESNRGMGVSGYYKAMEVKKVNHD